jgi:hypothetical protein
VTYYLIHKTFEGEPVGIHTEVADEAPYYYPGNEALEKKGTGFVGSRNLEFPWVNFVEELTDRISHRDWWEGYESDKPMEVALDEVRQQYTDARNAE